MYEISIHPYQKHGHSILVGIARSVETGRLLAHTTAYSEEAVRRQLDSILASRKKVAPANKLDYSVVQKQGKLLDFESYRKIGRTKYVK